MTDEKHKLLEKIHQQIREKKALLKAQLPSVHRIDDGVIIRFFTKWDNCEDDDSIKFKKIVNVDNPDESVVFFYIPKGASFDLKQRYYIGCVTCLDGRMKLTYDKQTRHIEGYSKACINSSEIVGYALENTYLLTSSDKKKWAQETLNHVKEVHG